MTKKKLELLLSNLSGEVKTLKEIVNGLLNSQEKNLTLGDAKMRDYIVRNDYIGKIKDKKIIEDFKKEIEKKFEDKFESIKNKILNYQFIMDDYPIHSYNRNILLEYFNVLTDYEYKQIVIDMYGAKKNETTKL